MKPTSVLHVNTWGGIGGAYITSDRLHQALLKAGVDSAYAYGKALQGSDSAIKTQDSYHLLNSTGLAETALTKVSRKLGLNDITRMSAFNLTKTDLFKNASVLNFHNLHSDFFSYLALPQLTALKPAVWTLHDMWSLTGHCAYSYDCSRWQTGCGQCPNLTEEPRVQRDATSIEWKLKDWAYNRSRISITAPSLWLCEQARKSDLLNRFDIHHIPYGIDTQTYQPLDPQYCRHVLGISKNKRVLMFGAQSLTNARKGGDLLFKSLAALPDNLKAETLLLTFGSGDSKQLNTLGMEVVSLGYVSSDRIKAILYSAADAFVFPTRADNLPLVLQESLACGTPIVSFRVGGVPDMVRPDITGFLAEPENAQDLRDKVVQMLEADEQRPVMRENCRKVALEEYPIELQRDRYITLYKKLLQDTTHKQH